MRILIFILCISIFSCNGNSNNNKDRELKERELTRDSITTATPLTDSATDSVPGEQIVAEIRTEIIRINALQPATKQYKIECEGGATVVYYFENNNIVKVTIDWAFLGNYSTKSGYYYKDGKFIFGDEVTVGGPAGAAAVTTEYRNYVRNDKVIMTTKNEKIIPCLTCQFSSSSREYKLLKTTSAKEVTAVICE